MRRIVVCVRPAPDGELGPFDAAAYECALRMPDAEVLLLAMAPRGAREALERLTRLGAAGAYLLCDPAFAGADTLATTYTLSLALARLAPELVFCGRQTMLGDTGQVGPGLAVRGGYSIATQVMEVPQAREKEVVCRTREHAEKHIPYPALLTFERIFPLRFPGLFSRPAPVTIWNAADLGAEPCRCGTSGSPTRVRSTYQNENDRRHCRFLLPGEFRAALTECLSRERVALPPAAGAKTKEKILLVGEAPRELASTVGENLVTIRPDTPARMAERIRAEAPLAVLWDSTPAAKEAAAAVAVLLGVGLCADCTRLELDGTELVLYRPAFAGDLIAAITSRTRPVMATVRTAAAPGEDVVFALGLGARDYLEPLSALAKKQGAALAATRAVVEAGLMPYEAQVGLTGKSVSPKVYVAFGVSGAVHHIAGMKNALSVIAVNRDKNAPVFSYADLGIVADIAELLKAVQ